MERNWRVNIDNEGDCRIKDGDNEDVAIILGFEDVFEANAQLIAAAPELYEALKEIELGLKLNQNNLLAETLRYVIRASIEIASEALAKVEKPYKETMNED